jgi:hypothetical protein
VIFTENAYFDLASLFSDKYSGYKPTVREVPNGDGEVDQDKQYLHVALKYDPPGWALKYLTRAHFEACRVAERLDVPAEFYPRAEHGALRVLYYPSGVGGHLHTDFDLFTVNLYRSVAPFADEVHVGEIGELVGLGPAFPHEVLPQIESQYSIVYFAIPDHRAILPTKDGVSHTVGLWLQNRIARSRVSG